MVTTHRAPGFLPLLVFLLAALFSAMAWAGDWPRWRGPNQDGVSLGNGVFDVDGFVPEIAWTHPLGTGYSGISVAAGRLVTMFSEGESDYLIAIDAGDGKEIWRSRIGAKFPSKGGSEGGPLSVPAIDEGVVYALGPMGHLSAVRLRDGSPIWSIRIDESLGAPAPHFGFATSPLVVDDLLFVQTGAPGGRSLVGLDKKTGRLVWSIGDDTVGYQSPIVATLAGRRQIVAVTDKLVIGLAPESGAVLWSRQHGVSRTEGHSSPVPMGEDRFLLAGTRDAAAFEIESSDGGYGVKEIWRTTDFKRSFATPVFYEDFLYGFSGDFLTCISARDGEKVWRSRPPGGRGLIVVDDHLIVFGAEGALAVVEASPKGYQERARLKVSDHTSYTYPSFADGRIFVRDTRNLAAVTIGRGGPQKADRQNPPPMSELAEFVREVERSGEKKKLIDRLMSSQERFPILEDGRLVHFIYRGDVEDVAVTGSMTELHLDEPMEKIAGTDVYYRTYPIEPGMRWEYRFKVDFETSQPDPLNPNRAQAEDGERSVLAMPGWTAPEHVKPYPGSDPGRLESFELESEVLADGRRIEVYLPPGYDLGESAYPLLIVEFGQTWLDLANLPNSLNHLIGGRIPPIIAVFVHQPPEKARDELGGARSGDHVRMLADELIPYLDANYRTLRDPRSRAILGTGNAAMMAVYTALERPEVFARAGGLSIQLLDPLGSELIAGIQGERKPSDPRFHLIWNRYELRRKEWGLDLGADSRRLFETLSTAGYEVEGGEVLDAAGWSSWGAHVAEILVGFFPR